MGEIAISEKFLLDTGGWQEVKHAKALVEMGRVVSFNYSSQVLRGLVREGETEFRAGLKIASYTDVENLCSCRDSREWGKICAHSLAVGLALINSKIPAKEKVARAVGCLPNLVNSADATGALASSATPIELHIVLAPNLESAWERGQLMVGFEVLSRGNRQLASALNPKRTFSGSQMDIEILTRASGMAGGQMPGMTILGRDEFLKLIGTLIHHPRVTIARKLPVTISGENLLPALRVKQLEDKRWEIRADCSSLKGKLLLGSQSAWIWSDQTFRPVSSGLPATYLPVFHSPIMLREEEGLNFVQHELGALRHFFEIEPETSLGEMVEPVLAEVAATFEGSLNHLAAKLQFLYGHRIVTSGVTTESIIRDGSGRVRPRNMAFERECLRRLQDAGFTGPSVIGEYVLRGQKAILNFFASELPALQKIWKISLGGRFQNVTREIERVAPRLEITASGEDWFDFSFSLESARGDRFSAAEVQHLLQMGQNFTRLKDGRLAIFDAADLEEFQTVLRDCEPGQPRPGTYRIKKNQAAYLDSVFEELRGATIHRNAEWGNWTRSQRQLVPFELEQLGSLEGILRPYQKEGVSWLRFLSRNGLGGILADEMGLGKTVQALAFLRPLEGTSLVVCPSSLLFNWAREAEKFVPELKVLCVEGTARNELFSKISDSDLVLTSYPLLRRDIDRYRRFEFAAIFLDEATHIKNPDTQNAQAAMALRGRHRFVLTGTPVENSVRDLWSIAEFVLPGYLGRRADFRERYELPIGRGSQPERDRLAKRLRPIMVRRLKQEVAKDLPDKIEQVSFCDLSSDQAELYKKLREEGRRKIEELSDAKDQGRARIAALTALLRLRQVCCDLRLLGGEAECPSGKIELLWELLEESIDGGHRVLVFSQFVGMLKLISAQLEEEGTPFCYLDGATKDRGKVVDRFQQSAEIPVFLISLKAGGVGLNLSAADTVIHFDPWWNPAVEAQATDRAHRIGQSRVVTAYKLICRNTVEEKILNLQRKKREVIDAMVESEEPLMTSLSTAEIRELLMS
ncbi:MAG TPA: SNF2-related protein [Chthoniobacterales bacterium]|nr:SNF2-related protein [Chthoniobacterales bacterium]